MPPRAAVYQIGNSRSRRGRAVAPAATTKGDEQMKVSEAMTRDVVLVHPDQPISEAAAIMEDCDIGSLPIGDGDKLVGMITDRDIAVRAVAKGMSPETPVREVMSKEVLYCFHDDQVPDH